MASITIRNLDGSVKEQLRQLAALNKRSMEEQARIMIRDAVGGPTWTSGGIEAGAGEIDPGGIFAINAGLRFQDRRRITSLPANASC